MSGDNPHPHIGHRSRMRERYSLMGLESFAPHEALEILLYNVIPQRNVNPLAHALIDRFGSLLGVLLAPQEKLSAVAGVGAKTARFLSCVGRSCELYASFSDNRINVFRHSNAMTYLSNAFGEVDRPQTWALCLDKLGRLVGSGIVSNVGWDLPAVDKEVLKRVLLCYSCNVILVDRRTCEATVTPDDVESADRIALSLIQVGVILQDMIVVGREKSTSLRRIKAYRPELFINESSTGASFFYPDWRED